MTVEDVYSHAQKLSAVDQERLVELIEDNLGTQRQSSVRDQDHLEELLMDGLNSGAGIEANADYWEAKERRVRGRLGSA